MCGDICTNTTFYLAASTIFSVAQFSRAKLHETNEQKIIALVPSINCIQYKIIAMLRARCDLKLEVEMEVNCVVKLYYCVL